MRLCRLQSLFGRLPCAVMCFGLFRQRQAACKCVQQAALRAFLIERMVGVLAVNINQLRADGFELRQRGGLVVDKAAAFAFGIDNAADR